MKIWEQYLNKILAFFKDEHSIYQEVGSKRFIWMKHNRHQNPLPVISLYNPMTDIKLSRILRNPKERVEAVDAWAAARHSRSPNTTEEIIDQMGRAGVDSDKKLEDTYKGYGHGSVADGASITVHINNVPMHVPFLFFNMGRINSGQEKSTRFQKQFGNAILHPLHTYFNSAETSVLMHEFEEDYQHLGQLALEHFRQNQEELKPLFTDFYQPQNAKEKKSLDSRVLDASRGSLLMGQGTGFAFKTTERDWARIIGAAKASSVPLYRELADQIEMFIAPEGWVENALSFKSEAPSLVRHTEADPTTNQNLVKLKEYLDDRLHIHAQQGKSKGLSENTVHFIGEGYSAADRMVAQYITAIFPGMDFDKVLTYASALPEKNKREISGIIHKGHSHYKQLSVLGETSGMTFNIDAPVSIQRDFNRHKQYGRFIQGFPFIYGLPMDKEMADQVMGRGFGLSAYLMEVPEFKDAKWSFVSRLIEYYNAAFEFVEKVRSRFGDDVDHAFVMNLMPLAHKVPMMMHGSPAATLYFPHLRVRPGGDITYRVLAYDVNQEVADAEPYLEGQRLSGRPDPASKEEFFNRS